MSGGFRKILVAFTAFYAFAMPLSQSVSFQKYLTGN